MKAPINRIINFSNVDGPGNRMAIFFQSCPLKCLYCHNPETINFCINCGACVKTCPVNALSIVDGKVVWDKEKCVNCDTCLKTCPNLSSPKINWMSVDEVMEQVNRARLFIKGITVSGGECTNHPEFVTELFKRCHEIGLTTFMDSNGANDYESMPELMAVTDKVMLDVKAFDDDFHKLVTGSSNQMILKNLDYLLKHDQIYEVRTVLLNNHEMNEDTVSHVAEIIKDKCFYKLIKYRPFGVSSKGLKYCGNTIVSDEELLAMDKLAKEHGAINTKIV